MERSLNAKPGDELYLDFKYADEVEIKTWDKDEVSLMAEVSIDNGDKDSLYRINTFSDGDRLKMFSDPDQLEKLSRTIYSTDDCCQQHGLRMDINLKIILPKYLDITFESISGSINLPEIDGYLNINTISGDITMTPNERPFFAKTISGDVELLITDTYNVDIEAKTISGEIYSNLEELIIFDGAGLRQVVGQTLRAKLAKGGKEWELETISGNVFLRKI